MNTPQEWNDAFDVFYNSIASNEAPGLDAYEKSLILTQAQNDIVLGYFNPRKNKTLEGYDDTRERQADFASITKTLKIESNSMNNGVFDTRSNVKALSIPSDIFIILNEKVEVTRNNRRISLVSVPLSYGDYDKYMSKPYKRPHQNQAWRLLTVNNALKSSCELIPGPVDTIISYVVRYLSKPKPIIVDNLGDDVRIEGYNEARACELDPILHMPILKRAVEIAKATQGGDINTLIALGQVSSSDLGSVQQGGK